MVHYFQEINGDFLAVQSETNGYYLKNFGEDCFEGRATAVAGLIGSVCTTKIARKYLRMNCNRVAKAKVPVKWRKAIAL